MLFNLFAASLQEYEKQTGIPLSKHPLADQLRYSDSAESVTAILQEQLPARSESGGNDRITKSLSSVVSVLYTLSVSVDLDWPFPLGRPIYAGFAILLATVKDVSALDPLVDLLESIEYILKHLNICTKVPHTAAMTETLVKTLVELLSTLGLATKLVKQRRPGTFVKKLFAGNYNQMVLERLDRLTLDEGQITASQILEVVYGLVHNMRVVMDDGKSSIDGIWGALEIMHHIVSDVNKSKRDKLQQDIQSWLSPPDPSINHKIACELRHTGTTAWFIQGDTFSEWKWSKTSSLLWIQGKPGAGKTILCSAIIQDIDTMKRAGLVSLAYYYCDFRDDKKKDLRGMVSSLLVQLGHQSDSYCDMVSKFYWEHAKGSRYPSDAALVLFLEALLNHHGQTPVYLILDALDECPTTLGMPPAQEKVLTFVRQLTTSKYPNLWICVTSRLEPDLNVVVEPLLFRSISLHDESGQREDIADYIKSVVYTDPKMQAWRASDKELVVSVLTHKVSGIFQWASCQFAYIRHCPRKRIQRTLDDLPETLDGTYQRILRDINKASRALAHRLFSCIYVARRPLRAEELAEIFAFKFKGGPFRLFSRGWRQEDLVNAVKSLQTTYSSLLSIAKDGDTMIIQFSHLSVQEFFERGTLANARANVSYYHIFMVPTHTLVAQACLDVLLRLDKNVITRDSLRRFPLAKYAAKHWLHHVRLGNLSNNVEDRMEQLFDPRKRHLEASLWIHEPDIPKWMRTERAERPLPLSGTALHYAVLWGLYTIVKFLVIERSQDVQAPGFTDMVTPLHLAAKRGHVGIARFLIYHDADVNARDMHHFTALHLASREGQLEIARFLVDHGAAANAQHIFCPTPLHLASREGQLGVARFLIDHGVNVNAWNNCYTPLHLASREGQLEVARLLIDHGADVNAQHRFSPSPTPLHLASRQGQLEIARLLIDHGADLNARGMYGLTPLHLASREGQLEVARFLEDHGAYLHARDINRLTPLHLASREGQLKVAHFLIDHGADLNAQDMGGFTPLHLASREGQLEVTSFLIDHGAYLNAQDMNSLTPLHLASRAGQVKVARFLIDHGADVNALDIESFTPLHLASREGQVRVSRFLSDHGADVHARDRNRLTPLHLASREGQLEVVRFLIDHGADMNARDMYSYTPLHVASREGQPHIVGVLLEHGADTDARDDGNCTPLHLASQLGHLEVVHVLIEHGTDANARDHSNWTPLHEASQEGHLNVVRFLLNHGADLHASDHGGWTPLQMPSHNGDLETVQVLLNHGATVNTQDNSHWTPLHGASQRGHLDVVRLLLEHGADVDSHDDSKQTPLHVAARAGYPELVRLLVQTSADIHSRNNEDRTPLEEASVKGNLYTVQLLLLFGAREDGA